MKNVLTIFFLALVIHTYSNDKNFIISYSLINSLLYSGKTESTSHEKNDFYYYPGLQIEFNNANKISLNTGGSINSTSILISDPIQSTNVSCRRTNLYLPLYLRYKFNLKSNFIFLGYGFDYFITFNEIKTGQLPPGTILDKNNFNLMSATRFGFGRKLSRKISLSMQFNYMLNLQYTHINNISFSLLITYNSYCCKKY